MATSAFKSRTKRTQIGSQENNSNSNNNSSAPSPKAAGGHRRSRSLSHYPRYYPEISSTSVLRQIDLQNANKVKSPTSRNASPTRNFKPGSCVNTGPDGITGQGRRGRGRSVCRSQTDSTTESPSETEIVKRRGRSAAPRQTVLPHENGRRRDRSVSVARYQDSDSESDMDSACSRTERYSLNDLATVNGRRCVTEKVAGGDMPKPQRGLRRCSSQRNLSRPYDSHQSYTSALTDDEGPDTRSSDNGEEKTIRAVYAQMKSFRSDHPTGDMDAVSLYEAMRSEVRHAVSEIRSEIKQSTVRKNSSAPNRKDSDELLTPNTTDVTHVSDIRKDYTAKLEQSEKRARDLCAELAAEEQRRQELARIVGELLPESKPSKTKRPSRTRRNSADRKDMSECLNEEAQKYFDEFINISNFEDSEFSSFEEERCRAPSHCIKTEAKKDYEGIRPDITNTGDVNANGLNNIQQLPVAVETDGVVLPWLQWETKPDDHYQFRKADSKTVVTDKKVQNTLEEEVESNDSVSIFDSGTVLATSSNGSNCSWSSDSSYACNMSRHNPSIIESFNLSSTYGQSRDKKYGSGDKLNTYVETLKCDYGRNQTMRSTYQDDDFVLHANNEAILIEKMNLNSRIESGWIILCGTKLS